jgi:hypothetical protein
MDASARALRWRRRRYALLARRRRVLRGLPFPRVIALPGGLLVERRAYLFWRVRLPLWVVLVAAGWQVCRGISRRDREILRVCACLAGRTREAAPGPGNYPPARPLLGWAEGRPGGLPGLARLGGLAGGAASRMARPSRLITSARALMRAGRVQGLADTCR